MFKVGDIVKHERFMDVALEVLRCVEMPEYYAVNGVWVNQGFVKSYDIGRADLVKVSKDQKEQWYRCIDRSKDQCLRKCDWEKI
jgi:hypothetical protein